MHIPISLITIILSATIAVSPIPSIPVDTSPTDEIEMMAHLLNGEAGADYCSDEMIYYVGSVALNRVESDRFPNTLEEVINQPGQYACTWDGNYNKEPSTRCYRIAEDLLNNGSVLPSAVVFQAEFMQGSGLYVKEGNLYFCYL